jgi:hypothetical protein
VPSPCPSPLGRYGDRATRSDLQRWLTNRQQPGALEISGPAEVAARWVHLRR